MTERACPYWKHCHQSGSCDDCEYHLKIDSYKKQIGKLRKKIGDLEAELNAVRGIEDSRMKELLDAEREGRIVVLPCKADTPIFIVSSHKVNRRMVDKVEKLNIDHFTIGEAMIPVITGCTDENAWYDLIDGTKEGDAFFLSEEDAIRSLENG